MASSAPEGNHDVQRDAASRTGVAREAGTASRPGPQDGFLAEFGLYVHYPLCRRRCGYCDFPTVSGAAFPDQLYTERVLEEMRLRAPDYRSLRLNSIYFGGGTPSLWPVGLLSKVLGQIHELFEVAPELEVTLEANPGTVQRQCLDQLASCGVNRLSLGVQSLDDKLLRALTRDHSAVEARRAVAWARQAGFANLSCDLIFAMAGQDLSDHLQQLGRLLELEPNHVSLYGLTLSRGSALFRAGVRVVEDDLAAEMLERGRDMLDASGYPQYEVSNYAAPPYRSRHNASCWKGASYLGLGAAAHSLLLDGATNVRSINPPFSRYLDAPAAAGRPARLLGARMRRLEATTAQLETLMLGLRTTDGVDLRAFQDRFGGDARRLYARSLDRLTDAGLIALEVGRIRPTARGIWLADELARQLELSSAALDSQCRVQTS